MSVSDFFDVVVVGGGSAGYAAARTAHHLGRRVAVVEGGKEVGGLCILRGCMPTKALLYAAEVQHLASKAALWGIRARVEPPDYRAVLERKRFLISDFARYRQSQLSDGRFELIRGQARFLNSRQLRIDSGRVLEAGGFILATGSTLPVPELPGLAEAGYWTSDDALSAMELPRSLVILGGGAVAVEFAQFFARMGVEVTILQRSAHLLKDFEVEGSEVLRKVFEREGIRVFTQTQLKEAGRDENGQRWVQFDHAGRSQRIHAQVILFALGRVPATSGLDLGLAGVATEGLRIVSDSNMRTSQPHIYAAGDCTGPFEIVNVAIQQGETAAWNVVRRDQARGMDYRLVTHVVFTEPQLAMVGQTEAAARRQGLEIRTASYPFADHGKSMIMDAMDGFVKLVVNAKSGEILGGSCVGPLAGELIHEIVVAMSQRMTAAQLAAVPHYHPTLAEIWTYPAEELA